MQLSINPSISTLNHILGDIVGQQIVDRIVNDINIDPDLSHRRKIADQVITLIMQCRKELRGGRDFSKLVNLLQDLLRKESYSNKSQGTGIKQLAWIIEAYLLLNKSSTASATVASEYLSISQWAEHIINDLLICLDGDKLLLRRVFTELASSLVLTAHPTNGIQKDYNHHNQNILETVQLLIDKADGKMPICEYLRENGDFQEKVLKRELTRSIKHLVRAKPYHIKPLQPLDESAAFLQNITKIWEIIPRRLLALETELKQILDEDFTISSDALKLASWVARDIDGNPTVSANQHFRSALQERIYFLEKYLLDAQALYADLSDDFTEIAGLVTKTFFQCVDFENLYKQAQLLALGDPKSAPEYFAYRIVLEQILLKPLQLELDSLFKLKSQIEANGNELSGIELELEFGFFDLGVNLIQPLRVIRSNKQGRDTEKIDLLIKKAEVFSAQGSCGHTRQSSNVINCLASKKYDKSIESKVKQTNEILQLAKYAGIKRQIISMTRNFKTDIINCLQLMQEYQLFIPSKDCSLPKTSVELVPLIEEINDLRNSYNIMIDALSSDIWQEYLLANAGKLVIMRGPSDSAKQNGFLASQWEMFRSKQLDGIVVAIFNAYLQEFIFSELAQDRLLSSGTLSELVAWKILAEDEQLPGTQEQLVIKKSIQAFEKVFSSMSKEQKVLWQKACVEKDVHAIKLVNFDGWGGPLERGLGDEYFSTVNASQPLGSTASYERTIQGGGVGQLSVEAKASEIISNFLSGVIQVASRKLKFDKQKQEAKTVEDLAIVFKDNLILDSEFTIIMDQLVYILRSSLREEIFGLAIDSDELLSEQVLRDYFRHVIKSPLVYLDIFYIASRPTSRSGSKIQEMLADYDNDLDKFIENISVEQIISILADVRAIPYAAMFTLLGGNHVSFYGFHKVIENKNLMKRLAFFAQDETKQEARLLRHIIASLEKGIMTADMQCYIQAHSIIEESSNPDYDTEKDSLIKKLPFAENATRVFINQLKKLAKIDDSQNQLQEFALLTARRNDAAVPRIALAISIGAIFAHCRKEKLNPLSQDNIPIALLDLLRKSMAAGAANFGTDCID